MAASGIQITALHWETLDTEGPTRAEFQANWAGLDAHIHDGRGAGAPVRTITNATAPAASGDVRVNGDLFQWWGTSLHTAADTATAQTLSNKTLDATCALSAASLSGLASGVAYGVVCAGTTATAPWQVLASLGTGGQLLQSNGAAALPSWTTGTLAGDVTGPIGANTIAAGAVTATKIASGTITATQIANATITADKLNLGIAGPSALGAQVRIFAGNNTAVLSLNPGAGKWIFFAWVNGSSASGSPSLGFVFKDGGAGNYGSFASPGLGTLMGVSEPIDGSVGTIYLQVYNTAGGGNDLFVNTGTSFGGNGTVMYALRVG